MSAEEMHQVSGSQFATRQLGNEDKMCFLLSKKEDKICFHATNTIVRNRTLLRNPTTMEETV